MNFNVVSIALLVTCVFAAPRPNIQTLDCHGKPAELYFLLDSSTSIWPVNFRKQLQFVTDIVDIFEVSPTHTRVGVASFSNRYRENFNLRRYDNKDDVKTAVGSIRQMYGGTYTFDALDGVRRRGLGSHLVRPDVVRIAIITTDGESYNAKKTREAARKLKDDGVTVFAVGIGKRTDIEELKDIASQPSEKFVFSVGNFDLLQSIRQELAMSACAVELQDAPIPGPACGAENPADVIFLADSSHMNIANTGAIYDFIADVTEDFNMETGNIHVGIESRYCGSGNMRLGRYDQKVDLLDAVRKTKHSGLHHLLKRLGTHAYREDNGGRNTARNMAVVFIDDQIEDPAAVIEQAEMAKSQDIEIFVVAIGDKLDDEVLKSICSLKPDRHIIRVDSYEHIKSIKPDFMSKFCHGL